MGIVRTLQMNLQGSESNALSREDAGLINLSECIFLVIYFGQCMHSRLQTHIDLSQQQN